MVSINYAFKEIISKIVYYGPGLSGKTTNLQYVFKKVPADTRGELISLATDADRTLYFDFLPVNVGTIKGFATKFQLYTVPGQVYYNATRKLVLRGVDGLVFVADSQREKMDENLESMQNLRENLEEYGYDIEKIPMVIQYNKRDLPGVADIEELEKALNPRGLPYFEAVATTGEGVFRTLKAICKRILDDVRDKGTNRVAAPPKPVEVAAGVAAGGQAAKQADRVAAGLSGPEAGPGVQAEEPAPTSPPAHEVKAVSEQPEIVAQAETHTTVVVSTDGEEADAARQQAPEKGDLEETTEKAVLKDEVIQEPQEPKEGSLPSAVQSDEEAMHIQSEEEPPPEPLYGLSEEGESQFDEEATQVSESSLKAPLSLGRPQMAESRRVKGKKGKFNIFGWFRKSKR